MTTIYLVRHAESAYTPDEYGRGLTEKGEQDAERVTQALRSKKIDIVISSPYRRAINTVQGIADTHHLKIELDGRFRERQLAEGPVENFAAAVKALWDDPTLFYPGGESNRQAVKRGIEAMQDILDRYRDQKEIVIGTHGNLMALIMQYYEPRYDYQFWKNELKMPDIYGLSFDSLQCTDIFHVSI